MSTETFKSDPEKAIAAAKMKFTGQFGGFTRGSTVTLARFIGDFHYMPGAGSIKCTVGFGMLNADVVTSAQLDHPDLPFVPKSYNATATAKATCLSCGRSDIVLSVIVG